MPELVPCPACQGLVRFGRTACPHCGRATSPLLRAAVGLAAAFGLGAAAVPACNFDPCDTPLQLGCPTAAYGAVAFPRDSGDSGAPVTDAYGLPPFLEDSGRPPGLTDAGEKPDAGRADAGDAGRDGGPDDAG